MNGVVATMETMWWQQWQQEWRQQWWKTQRNDGGNEEEENTREVVWCSYDKEDKIRSSGGSDRGGGSWVAATMEVEWQWRWKQSWQQQWRQSEARKRKVPRTESEAASQENRIKTYIAPVGSVRYFFTSLNFFFYSEITYNIGMLYVFFKTLKSFLLI